MLYRKMQIPFDIKKAKAGAKIITRTGLPVQILDFDTEDDFWRPAIKALLDNKDTFFYTKEGKFIPLDGVDHELDLIIEDL